MFKPCYGALKNSRAGSFHLEGVGIIKNGLHSVSKSGLHLLISRVAARHLWNKGSAAESHRPLLLLHEMPGTRRVSLSQKVMFFPLSLSFFHAAALCEFYHTMGRSAAKTHTAFSAAPAESDNLRAAVFSNVKKQLGTGSYRLFRGTKTHTRADDEL